MAKIYLTGPRETTMDTLAWMFTCMLQVFNVILNCFPDHEKGVFFVLHIF